MFVRRVHIENYRSIRKLSFPLRRLNVFVGANGVGKTNLYRALSLLRAAATGELAREIAAEGGMDSAFWAGARTKNETVRMSLACTLGDVSDDYDYTCSVGLKPPLVDGFALEPQLKDETLRFLASRRPERLLKRNGQVCAAKTEAGETVDIDIDLLPSETALALVKDPGRFPDLAHVRQSMESWRFYHDFRTDAGSPLRRPSLAVSTPTLAPDGHDLASVLATCAQGPRRMGASDRLAVVQEVVSTAFPGAELVIEEPERSCSFGVRFPEFPKRVFEASELSDGTLRFIALTGALLSRRPPTVVALNEPETSLHPDLMPALAKLIVKAAETSQVWVVTHADKLAANIQELAGVPPRRIIKNNGRTEFEDLRLDGEFDD